MIWTVCPFLSISTSFRQEGCTACTKSVGNPSAQVAQLVEQWTENPRVGGSIPPLGTIFFSFRFNV